MAARYRNRTEAGRLLGGKLRHKYADRSDVVVLALPRGGVPVGYEVARALNAPLDVFIVRKLGLPSHPEFAIGAIASGGVRVIDRAAMSRFGVTDEDLAVVAAAEERELERRERRYRGGLPAPDVTDKTLILVDDGLATGATMVAAATALRAQRPARLVVAVPVASPETCDAFREIVDDVVCVATPEPFYAVGLWYEDFSETSDEEVHELLGRAAREVPRAGLEREVRLVAGGITLEGTLAVPSGARGVVLFAHGSGSSRHSPRNRFVAEQLREGGLATLLMDLLSAEEEAIDARTRQLRFDIGLLAERLVGAIEWLGREPAMSELPVGLFGASTGGGAALVAAAARPDVVEAVVSRGGRPDLAGDALPRVQAPSLFIVGGRDEQVIELNRQAMARMHAPVRLEIVPGATHLFEEPGALEQVARLAGEWFVRYLATARDRARTGGAGGERTGGESKGGQHA
jgi:putative phosphoribosyl transferase